MTADEYRLRADEIRKQAARVREPKVREQLLLIAADWTRFAQEADERERRDGSPSDLPPTVKPRFG